MHCRIVASGSFIVGKEKDETLEAYLGSCVGVTICDRAARVGGLIHLLLPEPTGGDMPEQPEVYATTGLPLFLEALYEAGAKNDRLVACIAGGALIGPVSEQDLSLDVGGRTAEIVQETLRKRAVKISHFETGGYYGCKMSLNMRALETVAEPLSPFSDRPCGEEGSRISPQEINEAVESVQPIPQIALRIIRMIREDNRDMEDIASEVAQDQVISAKVINMCNSVLVGHRSRVDSVERALVALGEKKLLQAVVSAYVQTIFPTSSRGYSLCKGGIFQHAVGTAMVTHELAVFTGRASPDTAYTAGLLHDIGKIPLDQFLASAAPLFYRTVHEGGIELCKVEKQRFGISHTEAGELLASRWSLPKNLVDVVANHHRPDESRVDPVLVSLVFLADLLMSRFQVGHELERLSTEKLLFCLEQVGLSPEQFPVIVDRMPRSVFSVIPYRA